MKPVSIPVYCPACGAIFPSSFLTFGNDVKGLVLNRNMERCINCGSIAQVVDGVFDIANNLISIITAPKYTHDILTKFENAAKDAYNDKIDIEDLAEVADQVNPELGKTIRSPLFKDIYKIGLLILIIICGCIRVNIEINVNELIEQLVSKNQHDIVNTDQGL